MTEWQSALAAFGLKRGRLRSLPAGWTNTSVRVTCGDSDVVLRRHGGLGVRQAAVEQKQHVVALLHERGAPLAPPFAARCGHMAIAGAGHIYSASHYVPGSTREAFAPRTLGALLGRFHAASARLPDQRVPPLVSSELLQWLAAEFGGRRRSIRADDVDWRLAHDVALRLERRFRTLDRVCADAHVWVHGDARRANIVHKARRATFIDFDFLHFSERGYDIGTLLDDIAWTEAGGIDDRIARDVVQGYGGESALTDAQRDRVLPGLCRRNLAMLWYIARRHPRLAGVPLANARRALQRSCTILDRITA